MKAILGGRSPITAVMKSCYFVELAEKDKLPKIFEEGFGNSPETFFISSMDLKNRFRERFKEIL